MKNKQLLFFFLFLLLSHLSFGQKNFVKGRGLYIPGDPILYYNLGLGYEYLFKEDMSVQLVYNISGNDMRDTDGNANFKNEIIFDFRHYNLEKKSIQQAIFIFAFLGFSQNTNHSIHENIFTGDFEDVQKITTEQAIGIGFGKNLKFGEKFHLELFAGPKLKTKGVKTTSNTNIITIETNNYSLDFGWRAGINLAFQF